MRDLFICYAGIIRSRIAAEIARNLAGKKGIENYIANNLSIREACNCASESQHERYSRIFVMEDGFKARLLEHKVPAEKVFVLDVTGELQRTEKSVKRELEAKLALFFRDL